MAYLIKKTRFLDLEIVAIKMSEYKHFLTLLRSGQYSGVWLTEDRCFTEKLRVPILYSYGISQHSDNLLGRNYTSFGAGG